MYTETLTITQLLPVGFDSVSVVTMAQSVTGSVFFVPLIAFVLATMLAPLAIRFLEEIF